MQPSVRVGTNAHAHSTAPEWATDGRHEPPKSAETKFQRSGDLAISQGNYVVHDAPVLDLSALNLLRIDVMTDLSSDRRRPFIKAGD